MPERLLVAGSNSGFQLGLGHGRDAHVLEKAVGVEAGMEAYSDFPPAGWTIKQLSSGANHTLALLGPTTKSDRPSQLWVTGTGAQGQLGKAVAEASDPIKAFELLNWQSALALDGFSPPHFDADDYELKDVVCGWNNSYIVLQPRSLSAQKQDVLFCLGRARDNTFGELGVPPDEISSFAERCAHKVSFDKVASETGVALSTPLRLTAMATGLRHALAELWFGPDEQGKSTSVIVGWGSARHGQVGAVPAPKPVPILTSKRPQGSVSSISHEPQCMVKLDRGDAAPTAALLVAGQAHSIGLTRSSDGSQSLHAFGSNRQGQLAAANLFSNLGISADDVVRIACNWNSTQIHIKVQNTKAPLILGSGSNSRGQLGAGPPSTSSDSLTRTNLDHIDSTTELQDGTRPVMQIHKLVSGSEHSLLLVGPAANSYQMKGLKQIWGYGWNEHGNLAQGLNDETDRNVPLQILPGSRSGLSESQFAAPQDSLPSLNPIDVWAGFGTTFILADVD